MSRSTHLVGAFHDAFGVPTFDTPNITDPAVNKLRVDLIQEELDELRAALDAGDLVEVLDALTDLQYVLDGAYLSFGLWSVKDAAFDIVHESNMSKVWPDGEVHLREDGKILKGPNFQPPQLEGLIDLFE